jgi:hypothetical protein
VLLAGVISQALAVAGFFPAAAGAVTRGFQVYNLSSNPIKLIGVSGAAFDSTPGGGAVLQPGAGFHDFEQTYFFGQTTAGTATYQILGDGGQAIGAFNAHMAILDVVTDGVYCDTDEGPALPCRRTGGLTSLRAL